jgi:hypothetical protein
LVVDEGDRTIFKLGQADGKPGRQRNVAAFTTSNSGAVTSGYLCFSVWSALFRKSQLHNNPALNAPPSPDYQQDRKPLQWSKNVQAKENNENDTDAG